MAVRTREGKGMNWRVGPSPPNDLIQIMDNLRWAWGLLMGAQ